MNLRNSLDESSSRSKRALIDQLESRRCFNMVSQVAFDQDLDQDLSVLSNAQRLCPIEIVNTYFRHKNSKVNYHFFTALGCRSRGEFEEAAHQYEKALKIDHTHYDSLLNLGVCRMKLAEFKLAQKVFNRAIACNEEPKEAYYNKALLLMYLKHPKEALKVLNTAMENLDELSEDLKNLKTLAIYRIGKISYILNSSVRDELVEDTSKRRSESQSTTKKYLVAKKEREKRKTLDFVMENPLTNKMIKGIEEKIPVNKKLKSKTPTVELSPVKTEPKKTYRRYFRPSDLSLSKLKPKSPKWTRKIRNSEWSLNKERTSNSSFLQEGFNEEQVSLTKENVLRDQSTHQYISNKIKQMQMKLKGTKEIVKVDIEDITKNHIQIEELKFLAKNLNKPPEQKEYYKLDQILSKLTFFSKFPSTVRKKIIEISNAKEFEPETILFQQNSHSDFIYVIITGRIVIEKLSSKYGAYPIIVNSLSDGSEFGELAMMSENYSNYTLNVRSATCKVSEKTLLILIPKRQYQELILKELHSDIDTKIRFLINLPMFRNLDSLLLVPLVTNLQSSLYEYNSVILNKGEVPKGLYIVFKGHAAAYTEGYNVKYKHPSEFANAKKRQPKPKPFYTGNLEPPSKSPANRPLEYYEQDPLVRIRTREILKAKKKIKRLRQFVSKDEIKGLEENRDKYLIKERIPFSIIKQTDYFGGRSLFSEEELTDGNLNINNSEPSKFTIVVQSELAEIFLLTKEHVKYMPEKVLNEFFSVLSKSYEVDCPDEIDSKKMDKMLKYWLSLRKELIDDTQRKRFLDTHKLTYPYIR